MKSLRFRTWLNYAVPLSVFVGALAFYIYTGPPDISWLDGAHYQRRIVLTEVGEGPWDQPLYVLLSQPFLLLPWGSLAQRASLASAVLTILSPWNSMKALDPACRRCLPEGRFFLLGYNRALLGIEQ